MFQIIIRKTASLSLLVVLASCLSAEQMQQMQFQQEQDQISTQNRQMSRDHNQCTAYGFPEDTVEYSNCRMRIDQDRKDRTYRENQEDRRLQFEQDRYRHNDFIRNNQALELERNRIRNEQLRRNHSQAQHIELENQRLELQRESLKLEQSRRLRENSVGQEQETRRMQEDLRNQQEAERIRKEQQQRQAEQEREYAKHREEQKEERERRKAEHRAGIEARKAAEEEANSKAFVIVPDIQ